MATANDKMNELKQKHLILRAPEAEDGSDVWQLVRECAPLDENSMYCNLIQCDHFRETCVVAELKGDVVGWISGYVLPNDDSTFFVWQVAVSEKARGMGLAKKMLRHLLDRELCENVDRIQTTITRDNDASWALFRSFTKDASGTLSSEAHYTREDHFDGAHATEYMVTIRLPEPMAKAA